MHKLITSLMLSSGIFFIAHPALSQNTLTTISGFARGFIFSENLSNAQITILETGTTFKTDSQGRFGPFQYPVGNALTLQLEKKGYETTQLETVIVPPSGLYTAYDNLTFQVPSIEAYYFLAKIIGANIDPNSCHITTTITAYHKTLDDIPQGEPGAIVVLSPAVNVTPFYFDIFKSGPLKNKTNPFTKGLTSTSLDGGVAIFNLPPREEPYTISAIKSGASFSSARFICRKGQFINISPPRGPSIQNRNNLYP